MANDRIFIVHKATGEKRLLYKYYPGYHGYVWEPETLGNFIRECLCLTREGFGVTLKGDPQFYLETESDPPA